MKQRLTLSLTHRSAALVLLCLSSACASSIGNTVPVRPHGLIDLNARMPVGESPYGIAYGTPTRMRHLDSQPSVEAYLKPKQRSEPREVTRLAQRETATPAHVPTALTQSTQVSVRQAPPLLAGVPASSTHSTALDAPRYAEREQRAQAVEQFRGGDALWIGGGTLVIILLIVLLVLLLR